MLKSKKYFLINLIVLIFITSCDNKVYYEKNEHIENEKWNIGTKFKHSFTIPDTLQLFNIYLNIRNTTDYPNQNLFLFLTTEFPNGLKSKDTLECLLASQTGKWFGKGSGRIKDCRILFKPKTRFYISGKYNITIQHAMRDIDVIGITDIGLRLEKYN